MNGSGEPRDLCIGCAMCCNGTLFNRVRYEPEEEPKLAAGGLRTTRVRQKDYFLQPCPYEQCGRCTIYETRFEVCRAFDCGVLRQYKIGKITFEEARSKIDKALALRAAVESVDAGGGTYSRRQRFRRKLGAQLANRHLSDRDSVAQRLLAMSALDAYLDRWFRTKKSAPGS